MKTELTAFGWMLIAYPLTAATLFATCTAMFGFTAALWGFAFLFSICTLGFLAVWWQEERQWSRVRRSGYPRSITLSPIPKRKYI